METPSFQFGIRVFAHFSAFVAFCHLFVPGSFDYISRSIQALMGIR